MSNDTTLTAIRGLLDTLERELADQTSRSQRLEQQNADLLARLKDAHHDLALIQTNLADTEPRPAIEYLTAEGYVQRLLNHRHDIYEAASLRRTLGVRAAKIGRERGVLPIVVQTGNTAAARTKAWPLHIWSTAFDQWEASQQF